ncbi:MAG: RidA family protein, partial [Escherichia coli]|nr:reactive intermediate/imine deaminase [Escherichia coli]MBL0960880.1 RidA family protein [Escherichia coli]MBL0965201.1 RidA family protein [Escherichia coli]
MEKTILSTEKAPAAIGPYSQGIEAGNFVFCSGQLPINPATGEMPEDIKAQTEASIANVKAVLEAAGSSLCKVVKTTCFLADISDFASFNEVYAKHFP